MNANVNNFSVIFDGPYYTNFDELYKGVVVVIDKKDNLEDKFMHFAIRTKNNGSIVKTMREEFYKIIFNDTDNSITCKFDRYEKNKSKETIVFTEDEYEDLKKNIPSFMKEHGFHFNIFYGEFGVEVIF